MRAQDVSLSWHAQRSDDPTWHDPRELALRGSYPVWRFVHVIAGYSAASSTGHRVGTRCTGMAPPGYVCPPPEDLTDFGRFRTRSIGIGASVVKRASVDVRVVGLMHWVRGRNHTEARSGEQVLSATQQYEALDTGLEFRWNPPGLSGLGLVSTANVAWWEPRKRFQGADTYEPFRNRVRLHQVGAGLVWNPPWLRSSRPR